MPERTDLQNLARLRLKEAQILFDNNLFDGAFYVAGYAIECAFKAAICRTLDIDDFFEPKDKQAKRTVNMKDDVQQKFKTHDYGTLLILSGLYSKLESDKASDSALMTSWSVFNIVDTSLKWSEQCRYDCVGTRNQSDTKKFLESVNGFLTWIKQYW